MDIQLNPKQMVAASSLADITLVGGGNGGGKTGLGVRLPLANIDDPLYRGFLAMETLEKCKLPGGLLDEVTMLYESFGATLNKTEMRFDWDTGAYVKLSFVGQPGRIDGAQLSYSFIDQVEQGTQAQAFAVVSRMRSQSRARKRSVWSANPPPDGEEHWLTKLLDAGGYLDEEGYAIPSMMGAIRYFCRSQENDEFIFSDDPASLLPHCEEIDGQKIPPYSFTFVQMLVGDNPFQDEDYRRSLAILSENERLRRLKGKWKGLNTAGTHFKTEYFPVLHISRPKFARGVRSWDIAWATSQSKDEGDEKDTDPDWTNGVRMWATADSSFAVDDAIRFRGTPAHSERAILATAEVDGPYVEIVIPKDPGAAQGIQAAWADKLGARGYTVRLLPDHGDKLIRATPYIACAQRHQIKLLADHVTRDVSAMLLQPFELLEKCVGCQRCGQSVAPARCDGHGVVRIIISGLRPADVSTLAEWRQAFIVEHVRFGRRSKTTKPGAKAKLKGKKDQVDAAVKAYLYLTDPELLLPEHLDSELPGLAQLATAMQNTFGHHRNTVTGYGSGRLKRYA